MQGSEAGSCCHNPSKQTTGKQDPVCGMSVSPETGTPSSVYKDQQYYFCSPHCLTSFQKDPGRYLTPQAQVEAPPGTLYRCPMDPEVGQGHPGACPKCGMALEPVFDFSNANAALNDNTELREMQHRFWMGCAFSIPLLAISMGRMGFPSLPWHEIGSETEWLWVEAILATPTVFMAGSPLLMRGVQSFQRLQLNMFSLIFVGTMTAYLASLAAILFPTLFSVGQASQNHAPVYFESAAAITTLVLLGQVLEIRARAQTSQSIRKLLNLAPKTALQIIDGKDDTEITLNALQAGMYLRIRTGDKIPADGVVVSGETEVDESMLTGEANPAFKKQGGTLTAGTLNLTGSVVMEATRVGNDTVLAGIIQNIQQAQRNKPEIQRLADQVSRVFVPVVFAIAILTAIFWYCFGQNETRISFALLNSVSVLLIACPCALGLATPLSIMVATGKGATEGILFRDAKALEQLAKINTVIFDKTGTLTAGKPSIQTINPLLEKWTETELLQYTASLEQSSTHPLALAFSNRAKEEHLALLPVQNFKSVTGQGLEGIVNGKFIRVGNLAYTEANLPTRQRNWETENTPGQTLIFIAVNILDQWKLAGYFTLQDPIRPDAKKTIESLQEQHVDTTLLSGDRNKAVRSVAEALGISHWEGELSPNEKARRIQMLQADGRQVAMAGDGMNDAPALAQATVGIAMGHGSDIAIEAADVTLMNGTIGNLLKAIALSKGTIANIRQNLFFAFIYNALGIPIAAGALYPSFGILLSPMVAAGAMGLSSVCVALNALRLQSKPFQPR